MSWIHPIVGGKAAGYVVAFLILVAVIGFLANVPRIFPGPVTARERAIASRRWLGKFIGWGGLLFAVACWVAIVLLIAPVSAARIVVLHSRARQEPVDWGAPQLVRWDGTPCRQRDARELDIGPGVDAALGKLDADEVLARDDFDARDLGRHAVLEAEIMSTERLDVLARASHRDPGRQPLPSWLVESVEISTIMAYSRTHHVTQIIVAPGRTKDLSGWKAVGAVLSARNVELCLQHELSPQTNDRIAVERIAFARWSPTQHAVAFWALVEGRIGPEGATLHFRLSLPNGEPVSFHGELPGDSTTARLVPVCVGNCGNALPGIVAIPDAVVEASTALPPTITALDSAGRVTATARLREEQLRKRPVLVAESPSGIAWPALLDAPTPSGYDTELLRDELSTLQLELPTTIPDHDAPHVRIVETRGRIAIAAPGSVDAARAWLADHAVQAGAVPLRAREENLNLSTSLSWMSLPITASTHPVPLPTSGATVTAGAQVAALEAPPEQVKPAEGIAQLVDGPGESRFGVIAIDLQAALADHDPLLVIATLRSMAWVCAWVVNPEFGEGLTIHDDRDQERLRAVPLLAEEDYDTLRRSNSRLPDLIAIVLIGGHLLLAFRMRKPPTRRS